MRKKALLTATLAPLAAACVVWAAWTYYITRDEIPAVQTFGRLCGLSALDLAGGWRVRVGKESKSCPAGGGMLVYVLVEGPYDLLKMLPAAAKGSPLRIRIHPDGEPPTPAEEQAQGSSVVKQLPPGSLWTLITHRIAPDRPGRWRVEALAPEGEVILQSAIEATPGGFHPWIRWGEWTENFASTGPLAEGQLPHGASLYLGKTAAKERLPVLFPAAPDPGFVIQARGTSMAVLSNEPVVLSAGEYSFLARFWRNGEPWIPSVLPGKGIWYFSEGIHALHSLELSVVGLLNAGASRGDRLDLQLLQCAGGWGANDDHPHFSWAPNPLSTPELANIASAANRISNRIELRLEI